MIIKKKKSKARISKEKEEKIKNRICSRLSECKINACPHAILHRKHFSCKVNICSALKSSDKTTNCVKVNT